MLYSRTHMATVGDWASKG